MGLSHLLSRRRVRPWTSPDELRDWRDCRLVVADVETTGLRLGRDEIVSFGAVEIVDGRITSRSIYQVLRPRRSISTESVCVHGITAEAVGSAPSFSDALPALRAFVEGAAVVAHAAWVEKDFLNRALRPFGECLPQTCLDTAELASRLGVVPTAQGREPSLELLARTLGLPVHQPHHALGDAMTTAEVFLVLASRVEHLRGGTATLADLSGAPRNEISR